MPDPQVLYIVTAVVVLALVAWVVVVLARPADAGELDAGAGVEGKTGDKKDGASESGARKASSPPPAVDLPKKPDKRLDSHAEIRDEPDKAPSVSMGAELHVDVEEEEEPTGPNALILVTAVGLTDPGLKRKHNEDAFAALEDHHLFVIADGMGRHAAGEVASRLCVDAISEAFRTASFGPPREPPLPRRAARLRGATLLANERILAAAATNDAYFGMGTTVVSAYFSANN